MINKKTSYLIYIFTFIFGIIAFQVIYLQNTKSMDKMMLNKKISFLKLTTLPDLAFSTESSYIRHRSLTNIFSIYKDDGILREYSPSSFAISHSNIINNTPSKIVYEK